MPRHAPEFEPPEAAETTAPISKSQRKRDMLALQDLGAELVRLPPASLDGLDLPEALSNALADCRRITAHEARRRQMQYIGRLMRDIDAAPIAERLAALRGESDAARAEFHALERWRTRLLDSDEALAGWLLEYPDSDVQRLRQLVRNARKEAGEARPPRAGRELFRLLRAISAAAGEPRDRD